MTKWTGKVASLSPALALGAALSLRVLFYSTGGAMAACAETGVGIGIFNYTRSETTTQALTATGILLELNVNGGLTFTATSSSANSISFRLVGDSRIDMQVPPVTTIIASDIGIDAGNSLTIRTNSAVSSGDTDGDGIGVFNGATTTALTINTFGSVSGGRDGIRAQNYGTAELVTRPQAR